MTNNQMFGVVLVSCSITIVCMMTVLAHMLIAL